MTITFKDEDDNIVSFQETASLEEYIKVYSKNNRVVKEETFLDQKLSILRLHNWDNENHQKLVSTFFQNKYKAFTITDHQRYIGDFELYKGYGYSQNGILLSRGNTLYDANHYAIGSEIFFDQNSLPSYDWSFKSYWNLKENPDDEIFKCRYHRTTGKLLYIRFENAHLNPLGQASKMLYEGDIGKLIDLTGISQELAEYYMVPEVIPKFDLL